MPKSGRNSKGGEDEEDDDFMEYVPLKKVWSAHDNARVCCVDDTEGVRMISRV